MSLTRTSATSGTPRHTLRPRAAACLAPLALLALLGGQAAQADGGRLGPRVNLPAYQQECAACHMAYPPGLLPAASWTRLMGGLDTHYGTDASLDAATVTRISGWLTAHAGSYKRVSEAPPEDRITRSAWFERKHRRIDPQVWKHVSVKALPTAPPATRRPSAANLTTTAFASPRDWTPAFAEAGTTEP